MQRVKSDDDAVMDVNGNFIFRDSSPPLPDTIITADFLNSLQEEVAHVIESAGFTLSDSDDRQLQKAIKYADAILVDETLTVNGSAPYPTIESAFTALRGRYIAPAATVTIQLQTGMVHSIVNPIYFSHPYGERVYLTGNTASPVVVNCVPTAWARERAAITAHKNTTLRVNGIKFQVDVGVTSPAFPTYALKAENGGYINATNVKVLNFQGSAFVADYNGRVSSTACDTTSINCTGFALSDLEQEGNGWFAKNGGKVYVTTSTSNDLYGYMAVADQGGTAKMESCTVVTGTSGFGLGSRNQGFSYGINVTFNGAGVGFYVKNNSSLVAYNCIALNCFTGFIITDNSKLFGQGCQANSNSTDGFQITQGSQFTGFSNVANNNGSTGFKAGTFCYIGAGNTGSGNTTLKTASNTTTFTRVD